jgi:tripartite-type tricarboxylate transporter receptor subunit TctC
MTRDAPGKKGHARGRAPCPGPGQVPSGARGFLARAGDAHGGTAYGGVCCTLRLALAGLAPGAASAQEYPSRPIRLIVGFGPGAGADVSARILAADMSKALGQQIVVENRPGAGSNIAAELVVRAPKDGYTLLMGTAANVITGAIKPLSFDFARDLAPIVLATEAPNILVVHPSVRADTAPELGIKTRM